MIHLVTFCSSDMSISAQLCHESALKHGVEKVWPWTQDELKQTQFYKDNRNLLDEPRGCGYFAWKPFVVLDTLSKCNEGDYLVYADAGIEFIDNVKYIIDRMDSDVWLFGNMYPHYAWCKRDVISTIMPGADWDQFGKQCQASVIFLRVSDYSKKFIKEWLHYCRRPYMIDDSPSLVRNHEEFQEHRHDQAILTTLAYRDGLRLHWWGASYNDGAFVYERGDYPNEGYPCLFAHHRKRNDEWKQAA